MIKNDKKKQGANFIGQAVQALKQGGVIAYPTESCFGLGCDPQNTQALEKIIQLKQRDKAKGLIIVAANVEQASKYIDLDKSPFKNDIKLSWPGANTWLLPPKDTLDSAVKEYLCGSFPLLAVRVSAHPVVQELCLAFGGAIVSTSANLAGKEASQTRAQVVDTFGSDLNPELDYIVDAQIGNDKKPSTIRDGLTGTVLRN